MAELTDKELKVLVGEIDKSGLTYVKLQNELLDHLCCDIEEKMEEGMEFDRALAEVKQDMGYDCIRTIQEDTLLLVNQKYRIMKKFMYNLGIVAPTMVIIGTLLKIQHLPGSGLLMVLGLSLLALIYLPVFVTIRIRDTRKKGLAVNIPMYVFGLIAGIMVILGAMFKVMHWPGAGTMLTLSSIIAVVVFIPILVINALRDKENQVQSFTTLIFVLSFIAIGFMTFALRVSKDVMTSFLLSVDDNLKTEQLLVQNNESPYASLSDAEPVIRERAGELRENSNVLCRYIDELIREIIVMANKKNAQAIKENSIDFRFLRDLDSPNAAVLVMFDMEDGLNQGIVLEKKIDEYREYLLSLSGNESAVLINKFLDTSPYQRGNQEYSWIFHDFEHLPLISVVSRLIGLQANIRILEGEMLRQLKDRQEEVTLAIK